jgi:dihydrofolate reductase
MKKPISIIVAVASNNAIGLNNELLWHLPEDLKRFKKITSGHAVVMGKKTFESLPNGPLKNRKNIVITDMPGEKIEGCTMAYSIDEAIGHCDPDKENFIIGGGSIYQQFLPLANKLYITKVDEVFEANVFFPQVDYDKWTEISKEDGLITEDLPFKYTYHVYERK